MPSANIQIHENEIILVDFSHDRYGYRKIQKVKWNSCFAKIKGDKSQYSARNDGKKKGRGGGEKCGNDNVQNTCKSYTQI